MQNDSLLLKILGKSPELRIIDFLLDNILSDFSAKEIMKNTCMGKVTFYKTYRKLLKYDIIKIEKKVRKTNYYMLNGKSEIGRKIMELDMEICKGDD